MLINNLTQLKSKIAAREVNVPKHQQLWGGADVVIGKPSDYRNMLEQLRWVYDREIPAEQLRQLEEWRRDGKSAGETYMTNGCNHLLWSVHASDLSWLMNELKEYFTPVIDFANKYDFYGRLATAAGHAFNQATDARLAMVDEAIQMAEQLMETTTTYFAYGANMHEYTMSNRCQDSVKKSAATLNHWKWFINERGVSTVKPVVGEKVFGILWEMTPADEATLDVIEGVQQGFYQKDLVFVEVTTDVEAEESEEGEQSQISRVIRIPAKIYVDPTVNPGSPREGYLEKIIEAARMNEFPESYVDYLESWLADGC